DFFSIGSNDLTQYLLAVDRDNAKVTRHYNSLNPAFFRAPDYAGQAGHPPGKWIGLFGELGAKGYGVPVLGGLWGGELGPWPLHLHMICCGGLCCGGEGGGGG
ncbi:putative PEP-binding protein, partial [Escherichia coli]|uniref:putative PEP-binding protein n=1 Tax=Escherichia coli TaxID=562 RepID=UPI00278C2DF0